MFASVCGVGKSLHGFARVSRGLWVFARVCVGSRVFAGVCRGLRVFVSVCRGLRVFVGVCERLCVFAWILQVFVRFCGWKRMAASRALAVIWLVRPDWYFFWQCLLGGKGCVERCYRRVFRGTIGMSSVGEDLYKDHPAGDSHKYVGTCRNRYTSVV